MNTFQYLSKAFTHNTALAYMHAVMFFYQFFDKFEEWWFVHVIKKGKSLDYQVGKMFESGNLMKQIDIFVTARFILMKLGKPAKDVEFLGGFFKPQFILEFTFERDYLDWIDKVTKIQTTSDIMRFMVYTKMTTHRQIAHALGAELFEKFRTCSIKEAFDILSAIEFKEQQSKEEPKENS